MKPNKIDVNNIAALSKKCISDTTRISIQHMYDDLYDYLTVEEQNNTKDTINLPKFTEGYLYSLTTGEFKEIEQVNYARIYINSCGEVDYDILEENLEVLDMSFDTAERVTIEFIHIPISSCLLDAPFSIFHDVDAFMYVHAAEYSNHYGGFYYKTDKTIELDSGYKYKVVEQIYILPEGVILIYTK